MDWHQKAFIPFSRIREPVEAIYEDGTYWVLAFDPPSIVPVDAKTGRVGGRSAPR